MGSVTNMRYARELFQLESKLHELYFSLKVQMQAELIFNINWCVLISPFQWPCNDIVHFDRHWCAQNPDARDARLYLCWLHMRGASIFHTDAVEFIKCTQPRGALLSLGLVHFMLILWMQWYMKRGTLCAKAPGIGRKCAKRPLTVTASYSTGVMFLLDLDVPCLLSKNGMYYCLQWSQVILNK